MAEKPTVADIFEPLSGKRGVDANMAMQQWFAWNGQLPAASPVATVAIANDAIAPVSADILVDTEGGAATDFLQIVALDGTHDGMRLFMRAASSERAVTVRHQPAMTYGITLLDGADKVLSPETELVLRREGDRWREVRADIRLATAATATEDGTPGLAVLAADNDTTSRDKAATPAMVGAKLNTTTWTTALANAGGAFAPRPGSAAGSIGYITSVSATSSYTVPSGGTWFISLVHVHPTQLTVAGTVTGLYPGGQVLNPGGILYGFAWRVA